jgi:hypothetical protein
MYECMYVCMYVCMFVNFKDDIKLKWSAQLPADFVFVQKISVAELFLK